MCLECVENRDSPVTDHHSHLYPAGYVLNKSELAGLKATVMKGGSVRVMSGM